MGGPSVLLFCLLLAGQAGGGIERVELPGIENAYRLAPGLLSGGQPEGEAAFAGLAEAGVRTIVSVDGALPEVAAAQAHGMRYVHLPVGYDGIDAETTARLVKVMRALPGPVFVHCHHGKHRGPAAAGLCAMAAAGWTKAETVAWLKQAGTSADYGGLFRSVERFEMPGEAVLAAIDAGGDLPASVEPPGLVEVMVEVDAAWEELKPLSAEGGPAVEPRRLTGPALVLAEHFREAARLPEARERGAPLLAALGEAQQQATELMRRLQEAGAMGDAGGAELGRARAAARVVAQGCVSCHRRHRD